MRLLPVAAEELGERIARPQADADAVGPGQHRHAADEILSVCDSHGTQTIAEPPLDRQLIRAGIAC